MGDVVHIKVVIDELLVELLHRHGRPQEPSQENPVPSPNPSPR